MLTDASLKALKPGEFASDDGVRGEGRLEARRLASGELAFYYRYTGTDGKRVRVPLPNSSLKEARRRAAELRTRYQSGDRDLRDVLTTEARHAAQARRDAEAEELAAKSKAQATLGVLLDAYVGDLERAGKVSAVSVRGCLHRNIRDAMPKLWAKPVADVTSDDLLDAVAKLADADKLREAGKLRSYLRAAFSAAVKARRSAKASPALRAMRLHHNPAADLATVEGSNNARDRALSEAELRAYWHRISAMREPDGALLRFHLLTGAQRVEQLARLEGGDRRDGVIRLRDSKGRRTKPRNHDLPLIPEAALALDAMNGGAAGPYLFTMTQGLEPARYAVLQHRIRAVCDAMAEANELEGDPFTAGDLRRTVETRLAAAGVSLEVRAQLQSHGLGGVQAKHYDRHDYLPEKRTALETLHRILVGSSAKVTPIRKASGKRR